MSAFILQQMDQLEGGRFADVVGVGFEGQAQDADDLVIQIAEGFAQLEDQAAALVAVDLHHGLQQLGMRAVQDGHVRQGFDIFGETASAPAQAGVQEGAADAFVEPHAAGDFANVGAKLFTDIGDLVDEGDPGGQEGVGGVFDHFGGAQIGDQDRAAQGFVELGHTVGGRFGRPSPGRPGRGS